MTFRLTYEIAHDQTGPGTAGRVIRIDLECEPASAAEVTEALNGFLTAVTGEREALRQDTAHLDGSLRAGDPALDGDESVGA